MAKKNTTKSDEPLEKQLWKSADKLRKNIDAAEYKHIVLGLIFLKYISDAFEELYDKLQKGEGEFVGADPEDKDEYKAENVFFVPTDARWSFLLSKAKQPTIGKTVDDAMDAIEKENTSLKGVLPKVYARQNLDPTSLGELIDLIGNIALGDAKSRSADVLGHVFEYFLGEFALAEGKKGGQFYTPRSVVELLVEMLEPYKGRVFDPCCGSGGMFVQSEKFVKEHQGKINDISIYGQESNQTTWRLCKMNLAIRGIDSSQVKWNNEGSFLNNAHKDLKCDYILARPIVALSNRDIGFLPGDASEKINPYMQPLFDNLGVIKHTFNPRSNEYQQIEEMLKDEKLCITPLAYIRGRSLSNAFFIIDEAQNLTPHEVKTIITRAGEGTKMVFTGDLQQIDSPFLDMKSNGLSYMTDKMRNQDLFAHVNLVKGERSYLAELASNLL